MSSKDLVTYCGLYCGCRVRWNGSAIIANLASTLSELVDAHGYHHWMPHAVKEFDYDEFKKGLDFFSDKNSWLICHKGCKHGDGRPYCEIRNCCKERDLDLCFECQEFPCDRVKGNERMMESAKEYRKIGREKWLRHQVKKARDGYELHTNKHYLTPET